MSWCRLTVPNDAAEMVITRLGAWGKFHIHDLSDKDHPSPQYMNQKRRVAGCQYWLKKLSLFRDLSERYKVAIPDEPATELKLMGDRLLAIKDFLEPIEKHLVMHIDYVNQMETHVSDLTEYMSVLMSCKDIQLAGGDQIEDVQPLMQPFQSFHELRSDGLITGVIDKTRITMFQRLVYRIARGSMPFLQFEDIAEPLFDPETKEFRERTVFYIKCAGGRQLPMRTVQMCKAFGAKLYNIPPDNNQTERELRSTRADIETKKATVTASNKAIVKKLIELVGTERDCPLKQWEKTMQLEQKLATALMNCQWNLTMLVLEGWCPTEFLQELKSEVAASVLGAGLGSPIVQTEHDGADSPQPHDGLLRPTYFKINEFTSIFQSIVDTYGVARYGEVNPGLLTCVTFPFLFGVMYGDIGHGFFIFCVGMYLILSSNSYREAHRLGKISEGSKLFWDTRYVLTMMGFCGLYMGFLYNDCMSNPIALFKTTFIDLEKNGTFRNQSGYWPSESEIYPFGIDPAWYHKSNSLMFLNSMKMKTAVILGVIHMTVGVFMSLVNHLYFKDYTKALLEFVPRLIFLLFTFGYMCFMIVYKWTIDWQMFGDQPSRQPPPPNMIQVTINMFLSPGKMTACTGHTFNISQSCTEADYEMFDGQGAIQTWFLYIALVCVPILFVASPYAKFHCGNAAHEVEVHSGRRDSHSSDDGDISTNLVKDIESLSDSPSAKKKIMSSHEGHSFSDEMIHNAIHTIEYVLGCVSNTASYLRLWALSLAHAQLAEVFWDMLLMEYGILMGPITGVVGCAVWLVATILVLCMMDVLECFLHALRLHWVEFQNKFYYADGIAYIPYTTK